MSWTSPLTVPIRNLPTVCDAGLGEQRTQPLHRAGHRAAGDQHLGHEEVAALEPGADLLERRDQGVEQQGLRLHAERQPLLGQLEHARGVAHQGLVVQALAGSLRVSCHALLAVSADASSAGQLRRARLGRQAAAELVEPVLQSLGWVPRCPRAATTSPRGPRTGTATPVRPTSSSSSVTAQPRLRARGAVAPQRVAVGDGRGGQPLERAARERQRAPGVEDLAQRRAVGRARRPRSSRGCRAGTGSRPGRPGRPCRRGPPRGARSRGCPRRSRSMAGRASRTSSSHGSCRAAYSQNRRPAT